MWLAQPEETRHGAATFEHHEDLPHVELDLGDALVFAGAFGGATSPARQDHPHVGIDLTLRAGRSLLETQRPFEHAVVPLDGRVKVGEDVVEPGWLALVPAGVGELPIEAEGAGARLLLLGGEPLGERIEMWWNFVARDRDEITTAWREWRDRTDRFGAVPSALERIEAPRPPWIREGAP
jgi:quercetin 2,3-dioxygenase